MSVTVTVGSTPLTATSGAGGAWSVAVATNATYITGTSVTVTVSASKTGFTSPSDVTRTLAVDLTAPAASYTAPSSLQVGVAIGAMTPSTTATDIASYGATGLPPGLGIDSGTGVISGTPDTADANTASATVTVTDIAGNPATVSITFPAVAKGNQLLTGFAYSPATVTHGDTAPTVTAPTGVQTTLSYSATPATVCTVDASTGALTLVGAGKCEVTATAAGTANYNEATAAFTVTVQAAGALALNLDAIAGDDTVNIAEKAAGFTISGATGSEAGVSVTVTVGGTELTATSAAGGAWSVDVPANATYITGTSVTVTVSASKTGFTSPSDVTRTLAVDLTAPAASYTAPSSLQVGVAIGAMTPSTTATDIASYGATGLPPGLGIDSTTGAISGTPDTADANTARATVTVTDIAGNPATVSIAFPAVARGNQTLTGFAYSSASVTYGDTAPTVTPPTGVQTTLSYSATPSDVCTVDSSTGALTLAGAGKCEVTATAAPSGDYNRGTASYTVTVLVSIQRICNRTPRVRDRILELLKYRHSFKGGCGDVNETHLAQLESLDLGRNPSTESAFTIRLQSDDFEGLVNLERLYMRETGLSSLPAGVFSGLAALETLELDRNRLSSLPAGVFSDLHSLKTLELQKNPQLSSLPYDEFEALPNLTELLVDSEGRRGYQVAGGVGDVTLEVAAGGRTTYRVRLTHNPAYVNPPHPTLTVSSDTPGVVATPATLRFTKENWFRRQTVTVDAPASAAGETATLTHTSVAVTYDRPIPTVTVRVLESGTSRSADPLTAEFQGLPEAHDGETAFSFRIAFSEAVAVTPEAMRTRVLEVVGGAVTGAARVDGESGVWAITVTPDSREELSIALAPATDCAADGAVCTSDGRALSGGLAHIVSGPGPETQTEEEQALTASFEEVPEAHDGESAFRVRVAFSEGISISYTAVRDASFQVTAGEVTHARRVDGRRDLWEITIEPDSDEAVTVRLPETIDCAASGAICTGDGRGLSHSLSATVAGPAGEPERNTAATGTPTISGTPQVGEELTASTSGISDADGLDNASFGYQWIRTGADIGGATGSTYTPVAADEGKRLQVRVSFTDDAGHEERLTSAATDAVAAALEPLTASFEGLPAEHRGQGSFSFRVAFSDEINISYTTVRDASFTVAGGDVTRARRVDKRRDLWKVTIEPDSDEAVTVRLPETTDCEASGAICTGDGRPLSHSLSATVAGPVGIAVADARVEEGDGVALAFAVTLSRAASAALTVDYATADGSAHAGDDYRAASGTLKFRAGESSKTIEVAVLDDAHDEGEETLTLRLSNPSGGRLADGEATGTIANHDSMPRALLARFGRTAAVHVVEHVEERLAAPREPGFRGRFAGRELRRGMERDIARNFLRQLGGAAGADPLGAGVHGSLSGAPAAGTAPLGMPGPAGGGGHLAAASGPMGGAMPMGGAPGAIGMAAGPLGGGSRPDGRFNGGGLLRMGLGGGDVLTGSDFALGRVTGHGGILSFWSRGAQSRFSGREGALSLGGDVRTTMFGADYAKGPLVTGLSLSHSRGLGEYAGVAGGQVASSVTGLYPWLGYKATERVTVWGVAGYGSGGLLLTPQGGPALESGLSMAMAAAGTRGELVAGGAGGFALAFKADALWVGTSIDGVDGAAGRLKATDTAVTRFRTGLEGSRDYTLAGRLSLRPSVEVGLRHDGGDAETGAGMDVGGGLVVSDASTGLAIDVRVRMLVLHQAEGFRERGMAVSLSYNPRPSTPLGFVARVAPSWGGQATSGAEALWGQETMGGLAHGGLAQGNRVDGEVGYGLPVGRRFVGTPTLGVGTSEYGRDYRLGYRLGALGGEGTKFELGVDAQRRESALQGATDHAALARATMRW